MKTIFFSLPALMLCASCATLFSDSNDKLTIHSDPEGAEVYVNGIVKGKTPLEFQMERDTFKKFNAQVKKNGYEVQEFQLTKTLNTTTLFNIGWLCFSETSAGIDALSGAIIRYSPTSYMINLKRKGAGAKFDPRSQKTLFVLVSEQQLRRDLAEGGGAYLDSLVELYGLKDANATLLRDRILSQRARLVKIKKAIDLDKAIEALVEQKEIAGLY